MSKFPYTNRQTLKSAHILLIFLLLALALFFFRDWKIKEAEKDFLSHLPVYQEKHREKQEAFLLAVASDLHADPDNQKGLLNDLTSYNTEIIRALLWDVTRQDADVLLLCGDLTNAGSLYQHETLSQLLQTAQTQSLKILVIPGNHDLDAGESDAFQQIYQDFGYSDACSRDQDSLSYSLVFQDHFFLLLDTGGSLYGWKEVGVSEDTLRWMREQLEYASREGLPVIAAGHYPVLSNHPTEVVRREAIVALLEEYEVPLYLCGHMHQKGVAHTDSLTELVVEQATASPCSYALLYSDEPSEYEYIPRTIDVSAFAASEGISDDNLLSFSDYQNELVYERCSSTIEMLAEGKHLSQKQKKNAKDFYYLLLDCYRKGTLSQVRPYLDQHPGYRPFLKAIEQSNYDPWIHAMIEGAEPYAGGFLIRNHHLRIHR